MKSFTINQMSTKDAVKLMMIGTEYDSFKQIAEQMGLKRSSTFQSALDNNSLRLREFREIADLLGYEIKIEQKEKVTQE